MANLKNIGYAKNVTLLIKFWDFQHFFALKFYYVKGGKRVFFF